MNKKLLAVAVAGALAAPGVALAQSSVTISGTMKMSVENVKIGNLSAARPAGANSSYTRLADDSSRIIFSVVEDLGGGLSAIGQYDIRIKMDDAGPPSVNPNVGGSVAGGNTFLGLRSKAWGQMIWGRRDVHYVNTESYLALRGDLRADSTSLLSHIQGTAIANASRTQNIIHYTTPNWGGFTAIIGYSTNPSAQDLDGGTAARKGSAWVVNPNFEARNFQIGYSYWRSKPDAATTATTTLTCPVNPPAPAVATATFTSATSNATGLTTVTAACTGGVATAATAVAAVDQRGDRLYGSYAWGGFRIGVAWDKSRLKNGITGADTARRTAWSVPVGYTWGPHEIHAHYTKARDDKVTAAQDGAKMIALSYAYSLSKRTSLALTYARIRNDVGATYQLFTSTSLGDSSAAIVAGEDPRIFGLTMRHAF
jgi:predicted porin